MSTTINDSPLQIDDCVANLEGSRSLGKGMVDVNGVVIIRPSLNKRLFNKRFKQRVSFKVETTYFKGVLDCDKNENSSTFQFHGRFGNYFFTQLALASPDS